MTKHLKMPYNPKQWRVMPEGVVNPVTGKVTRTTYWVPGPPTEHQQLMMVFRLKGRYPSKTLRNAAKRVRQGRLRLVKYNAMMATAMWKMEMEQKQGGDK